MAPKHRAGPLRTHSRTSSASKLGGNLQFTQKDTGGARVSKTELSRTSHQRPATTINRSASTINQQAAVSKQYNAKVKAGKQKPGFTLDDNDDDEWVSSASGAATPNNAHSDSEDSSTPVEPVPPLAQSLSRVPTVVPVQQQRPVPVFLPVISNGYEARNFSAPSSPENSYHLRQDTHSEVGSPRPRPPTQRHSITRPPSTHSIRLEAPLRPHPLIRANSHHQPYSNQKPAPLAPLTVIPAAASADLTNSPSSYSPPLSNYDSQQNGRRTSISSVRSVATLPVQAAVRDTRHDRNRTLSTISLSASSAALSSLSHLPATSRPATPQTISFFPPVNPHINLDAIHPLIPAPYLMSHLTLLSRRIPLRESYDRVIRAKQQSV